MSEHARMNEWFIEHLTKVALELQNFRSTSHESSNAQFSFNISWSYLFQNIPEL